MSNVDKPYRLYYNELVENVAACQETYQYGGKCHNAMNIYIFSGFRQQIPRASATQGRKPLFIHPRPVCMGFLVDKVAPAQLFLPVLQLSPVSPIPPLLHTHQFI